MSASDLGLVRPPASLASLRRSGARRWLIGYATLALLGAPLAVLTMRSAPQPTAVAFAIVLFGAVCIVARPIVGVYLVVFFTLLGDSQLAWWYPFTKNLSSIESVLYVHDALIFSPLELYLVLTFIVWLVGRLDASRAPFERGTLLWPVLAFAFFVFSGFAYGIATDGNVVVALWEARPITYVPLVYVLVTNLCTSRRQYALLLGTAVAAISLEAVHALYVIATLTGVEADRLAGLGYLEHSASLHANVLIVWLVAAVAVREQAFYRKWTLAVLLVPVGAEYLLAERRSAVVALIAALLLMSVVLHKHNPWAFWGFMPLVVLLLLLYVVAFWNVGGPVGLPAQAIKSAIAPTQLGADDLSSNYYRVIETYNLVETIRTNPALGLGFGHKFLRILELPWIPFVWTEYMPHNSMLWIWANMGVGGFVAMLYLFGASVKTGARAAAHLSSRQGAALALTATLFVVMYAIYAYVDIAWDTGSMVFLGLMLALIGNITRFDDPSTDAPDPDDRVPVPTETDKSDAPFGTLTVVFTPQDRERWVS
jgi:hypothetical protein